jgi:hypothetical protein
MRITNQMTSGIGYSMRNGTLCLLLKLGNSLLQKLSSLTHTQRKKDTESAVSIELWKNILTNRRWNQNKLDDHSPFVLRQNNHRRVAEAVKCSTAMKMRVILLIDKKRLTEVGFINLLGLIK